MRRIRYTTCFAIAFGLAHLYQGVRGVLLTGVLGAYLAWLTISSGSLLPAMAIHALIDLRVLALPDLGAPAVPLPVPEGTVSANAPLLSCT